MCGCQSGLGPALRHTTTTRRILNLSPMVPGFFYHIHPVPQLVTHLDIARVIGPGELRHRDMVRMDAVVRVSRKDSGGPRHYL